MSANGHFLSTFSLPTQQLAAYVLHLADSALVQGHRNSEWTGHGPILEQDIALSNISLDLIGQARLLYQLAARLINEGNPPEEKIVTEDTLAFLRDARAYRNFLITELPNGDWGRTILKQFFFSTYQYLYFQQMKQTRVTGLSEIAEKAFKEVSYHYKWSAEWVIRLGDGTEESNQRMQKSLEDIWPYTAELYSVSTLETALQSTGVIPDMQQIQSGWIEKATAVLQEANLIIPDGKVWMHTGGKEGLHTEHLGFLLAEMQYMQRTYPDCDW